MNTMTILSILGIVGVGAAYTLPQIKKASAGFMFPYSSLAQKEELPEDSRLSLR